MKSAISTTDAGRKERPSGAGLRAGTLVGVLVWLPVAAAAAYLAILATQVPRILADHFHWLPDFVWAPLLTEDLMANGFGGLINVGEAAHYSSIWLLMLTAGLPFGEVIWDISPLLITSAGVGLMGWAAQRIGGTWAGLLTAAVGVSAGSAVLATTITAGMRSHTWLALGATSALLAHLVTRSDPPGVKPSLAVLAATGLAAGVTVASDPLFVISGLVPFVAAASIAWLLIHSPVTKRAALIAWGGSLAAIGFGLGFDAAMRGLGFRRTLLAGGYSFVTLDQFVGTAKRLLVDVLNLTNGNFFGRQVGLGSIAALAMAAITLAALCVPFALLRSTVRPGGEHLDASRAAYVSFWCMVLLATTAAYLLSPIPSAMGQTLTARYLVPVFFALAALVPLWPGDRTWRKLLVVAGTSALCGLSILGLWRGPAQSNEPIRAQAPRIEDFLSSQGVTKGYGSYRLAHTFTYNTGSSIRTYPVFECRGPQPDLCAFPVNTRSTWYEASPGVNTFLITDPRSGFLALSSAASQRLGRPAVQRRFGELSVFVYEYDIASRFVSAPSAGARE